MPPPSSSLETSNGQAPAAACSASSCDRTSPAGVPNSTTPPTPDRTIASAAPRSSNRAGAISTAPASCRAVQLLTGRAQAVVGGGGASDREAVGVVVIVGFALAAGDETA